MVGTRRSLGLTCVVLAVVLPDCTGQPRVDLAAGLKGIQKSTFLSCSGPPVMEISEAGQDRMSFVTNLKRGAVIGVASPTALPPASCSVDATFEGDRLVNSSFSGDLAMCNLVFGPCLRDR